METNETAMNAVDEAQLDPIGIEERMETVERRIVYAEQRMRNVERRLGNTEQLVILVSVAYLVIIMMPDLQSYINGNETSWPNPKPTQPTQTYPSGKNNDDVIDYEKWLSQAFKRKKNGIEEVKSKNWMKIGRSANNRNEWNNFTLVHVGKCAGGSAFSMLGEQGMVYSQVHERKVVEMDIKNRTALIVTVRDPVNRTISAYNWRNPQLGFVDEKKLTLDEKKLYRCFKGVNDFANALNGTDFCSRTARKSLTADCVNQCYGHLSMGLRFYFSISKVHSQLEEKKIPVWLVHAENFQRDIGRVIKNIHRIRGDAALPSVADEQEARLHSTNYTSNANNDVDARGRKLLTAHLNAEYKLLRLLEEANSLYVAK